MKVTLVFPPQGHFTQPYLSLPSLAAYLRQEGVAEVSLIDANIEAYDAFLSGERLARSLERARAPERLAALERDSRLRFRDFEPYQLWSELALAGEHVVRGIDEAKRVLRTPELFHDYERYLWAGRTIEQGLRLFSSEFVPTRLGAHGFVMRYRMDRSGEILAALEDEAENPFLEFFRERVMPRIVREDPDLVGLSVTFASQAVPALTLARLIKAWKPEVHVTIGGGLLAYVAEKLVRRPELWELVDSLVLLEGERPLAQLCEVVRGERRLADVTNLIWRDAGGEVRKNPEEPPLDIRTLPTPDFDGLPLELYLSPELTLPLAITRGCYWGKCVFCTLYTVIGPGYRGRTVEQTVEDLARLQEKYGVDHFYMVIEDLPPAMARVLPRAILDAGLRIHWWCDARLEHEAFTEQVCRELAASGCRRMAFGYESASRRVLDAMCKGIDPEASLALIRRVRAAGISVSLYVMIGFPTETLEEGRETLEAVLGLRDVVQEVSARVFYLDEQSEVFRRREEFGIVEVFPEPGADLQVYYDFRTDRGMTRGQARELYLELTAALREHFPVFQNTNLLYHELKSHYFLYLCRAGSWEALRERVLERPGAGAPPDAPQRRRGLVELSLAFDRARVDETVGRIDSSRLRPRYQADLLEDGERERLDRELEPLTPEESRLVYHPGTGEIFSVSPGAADLLARCDGSRAVPELLATVPDESREDALACVRELFEIGLLEPVLEEEEART